MSLSNTFDVRIILNRKRMNFELIPLILSAVCSVYYHPVEMTMFYISWTDLDKILYTELLYMHDEHCRTGV